MARIAVALVAMIVPSAVQAQTKPPTIWDPAASCNYTSVSYTRSIKYVIIHTIEGSASGARSWFKNCSSRVSAHYVVGYSGTIWQMVRDKDIAWHASNWNSNSIGIEHEGWAARNNWTDAEYRASAALTRWICLTYGIPMDRTRIKAHSEVSSYKSDPGPYFNWNYYMSLVRGGSSSPPPPAASSTKAMEVTTSSLNVRNGPGTGYSIIGGVSSGQRYVSIAVSGSWHKIYYAGNTGWCHGGYLSQVTGVTGVTIATDVLNVRTGPSTSYSIVGSSHSGEKYIRVSVSGSWYKIYYKGGAYWVHGGYTTTFGL